MATKERDDAGIEIRPRKRKEEDNELDITPMIDITFLLLAFFVVASKMDPSTPVEMPRAQFGEAISEKDSVVLIVTQGDTPDSHLIFRGRSKEDGSQITESDPIAQEEAVAYFVEQQLSSRPDVQTILIKAEGRVKTGAIETVKRGIAGSELAETRFLYVGVEEEK